MRILVTNDDGISSIGLHVLARTMRRHGDVVIVAPDTEYSGAGAALGSLHLLRPQAHHVAVAGIDESWTIDGPPALCIMLARFGLFGAFDLVVSGINPGANVGRAVYHSGTVGAALTARNGGISAVAVSQAVAGMGVEGQGWDDMIDDQHWQTAADVASSVVAGLVAGPPADPVVVNVNVPNLPTANIAGWRYADVSLVPPRTVASAHLEAVSGTEDCFAVKMHWGEQIDAPPDTDTGAIERDEVTISYLSRLTHVPRGDLEHVDENLRALVGSPR